MKYRFTIHTFTTDDKTETNSTFFQTDYESTLTGLWESAPCREEIESYPAHEMMAVLSGLVSLKDADGHTGTFATGDTFSLRKVQSAPEWEIHGIPQSGAGI